MVTGRRRSTTRQLARAYKNKSKSSRSEKKQSQCTRPVLTRLTLPVSRCGMRLFGICGCRRISDGRSSDLTTLVLPPFACAPFFSSFKSVWGSARRGISNKLFCSLDQKREEEVKAQTQKELQQASSKQLSSSYSRDAELANATIFQLGRRSMQQ